jgi:hypothetical protein
VDKRLCSKVACPREAVATLTYDYESRMVVVGPLAEHRDPHAHDLCPVHAERMTTPDGWTILRHEWLRV